MHLAVAQIGISVQRTEILDCLLLPGSGCWILLLQVLYLVRLKPSCRCLPVLQPQLLVCLQKRTMKHCKPQHKAELYCTYKPFLQICCTLALAVAVSTGKPWKHIDVGFNNYRPSSNFVWFFWPMVSEIFMPSVSGEELINKYFCITWQMTSQIDKDVPQQNAVS